MKVVKSCRRKKLFGKKFEKQFLALVFFLIITIQFAALMQTALADPDEFSFKWSTNYGFISYSSPVAQDIDGDGIFEIFVGGRHSSGSYCGVVCINSLNGDIIWSETFSSLQSFHVPIAIGDLDNDGTYELVHAAGSRTIARNCEDGSIFWDVGTDSGWGVPAIVDFDGTGIPYVIVGDNSGFNYPVTLSKLYGNNGTVAASSTKISYTCYGGVSVADLDRDGDYEIVMSDSGNSHCFDEDLNELWTTSSYVSESHCAVLVDVVGDEDLEVVIMKQANSGVEHAGIYVYEADGTPVLGKCSSDLGLTAHCQPSVYDVDRDGNLELITAFDHEAEVWDLGSWSLDATLERGAEPPDIANVVGDSDLEIVSPFAFSDANTDVYDSSYSNPSEVRNYYGLNSLVVDTDNDGLNELIIHGSNGLISLHDTLAQTAFPAQRGDTPYYSERRNNAGVYIPKIGKKCLITSPSISEGTEEVSTSTSLISVHISEPNGDPISWTIETSPNIGSSSGSIEGNGTKSCTVSGLDPLTSYSWYINATDGSNWISESYQFTTANDNYPSSDFYVDGTYGDDNNDGSFSRPWATIQHAADSLRAGDTLYIKEGVYYEYLNPWNGMSSGSAGNWITYTNYQNDEVIIDGYGGTFDWTGIIKMDDQSYIRISNLIVRNSCSHGILIHDGGGDASNIRIDNCTIINCSDSAIQIRGYNDVFNDVLIDNNLIIDCENGWNDVGEPSDEVISLGNVNNFIIRDNIMYDNHKINIDAKSGSRNGVICGNRINTSATWSCQWGIQGIYVDAQNSFCENISIFNNIVWGNGTGYEFGTEQGGTLKNIRIFNNIYNGSGNGFQINDHTSIPGSHLKQNLSLINNICSENTAICVQLTDKASSFQDLTIRNNIFNGSVGLNVESDLDLSDHDVDHNLFHLSVGSDYYGAFNIIADPLFSNPTIGDYSLRTNSPAIDAGSSLYAPSFDFIGVERPQGNEVDIGVYESTGSGSDNIDPQMGSIILSHSNILDTQIGFGWENFSCLATDNVGIETVQLHIAKPNDDEIIHEMIRKHNSDSYYFNTTLTDSGNYQYFLYVEDTSNNAIQSVQFSFTLHPNWDINMDGEINLMDLVAVSNKMDLQGSSGWIREDVDNNGEITVLDIVLVSNYISG